MRYIYTQFLFLFIFSNQLYADTIDVCIVGYFKKGECVFIKNSEYKMLFWGESKFTGNHRWDFKLHVSDSIPDYSHIPIRFYYCKKNRAPTEVNLLFLKQNDRKFLVIERHFLYKNTLSFRVIWLDHRREDLLLPEYQRSLFTSSKIYFYFSGRRGLFSTGMSERCSLKKFLRKRTQ
jgi:hypothetical protein